jgi:hypothetical protein
MMPFSGDKGFRLLKSRSARRGISGVSEILLVTIRIAY